MMLGWHYKERPWRWAKTLFFLITMLLSLLLVCAPPLLVAILDVLIPSALLSSRAAPSLPPLLTRSDFHASLLDLPVISAARSLLILCVYVIFSGRGAYLAITTACSLLSAGYVAAKAATMMHGRWRVPTGERDGVVMEMLFLSSLAFAVAHIVVAYKTSCRERRKMIVYHIDIEAISTYHNDFPSYSKIGLSK